jgi:hypothetical protein
MHDAPMNASPLVLQLRVAATPDNTRLELHSAAVTRQSWHIVVPNAAQAQTVKPQQGTRRSGSLPNDSRPALPHRFQVPTVADVRARLEELIADSSASARDSVAAWASEYLLFDNPQVYPRIDDQDVWEALANLAAANMISTDRPYLYGTGDFTAWLRELPSDR